MKLSRPSASLLVAVLALVVALGGVSYAAVTLPKNSVGTPQLKKGAVTTKKLKADAVTGKKVNESSLVVPGGRKSYSAEAFRPQTNEMVYEISGESLMFGGGSFDLFTTRLDLPDGATVSRAEVFAVDNSADFEIALILRRIDVRTGQFTNLRLTATSGSSVATRSFDASPDVPFVIDNDNYDYTLNAQFLTTGPSLKLTGAIVSYSAHPLD